MTLSPTALLLIGLLLAAWTVAALWVVLWGRARQRKADAAQRSTRKLSRLVDESPAIPMVVRADGRIEAPQRLANWLGLETVPQFLTELDGGRIDGGGGGLTTEQLQQLSANLDAVDSGRRLARLSRLDIESQRQHGAHRQQILFQHKTSPKQVTHRHVHRPAERHSPDIIKCHARDASPHPMAGLPREVATDLVCLHQGCL